MFALISKYYKYMRDLMSVQIQKSRKLKFYTKHLNPIVFYVLLKHVLSQSIDDIIYDHPSTNKYEYSRPYPVKNI